MVVAPAASRRGVAVAARLGGPGQAPLDRVLQGLQRPELITDAGGSRPGAGHDSPSAASAMPRRLMHACSSMSGHGSPAGTLWISHGIASAAAVFCAVVSDRQRGAGPAAGVVGLPIA